jgi:hypothetical protein
MVFDTRIVVSAGGGEGQGFKSIKTRPNRVVSTTNDLNFFGMVLVLLNTKCILSHKRKCFEGRLGFDDSGDLGQVGFTGQNLDQCILDESDHAAFDSFGLDHLGGRLLGTDRDHLGQLIGHDQLLDQ